MGNISKTAILKAKENTLNVNFLKILDFKIHKEKNSNISITRNYLVCLTKIKKFFKKLHDHKNKINDDIYLIHLLTIYGKKEQKYGLEYFSNKTNIKFL